MGIYIKGMEMPTTYPLTVTIYPDGQVLSETVGAKDKHGIAIHVPPHGRLIEKNAVFELIRSFPNVDRQLPVEFMKALYELPTILEAEEGE
jgi:hypothetical protein